MSTLDTVETMESKSRDVRLDSWKEIAAHLKRDIRTVQRWEKLEGLPVHRHQHLKRGSPFGYAERAGRVVGRPRSHSRQDRHTRARGRRGACAVSTPAPISGHEDGAVDRCCRNARGGHGNRRGPVGTKRADTHAAPPVDHAPAGHRDARALPAQHFAHGRLLALVGYDREGDLARVGPPAGQPDTD